MTGGDSREHDDYIAHELGLLPDRIGSVGDGCCKLITCVPAMVRISVKRTEFKELDIVFQFPENYPDALMLIELKSKVLPDKFLDGLIKAFESDPERFVGRSQVLAIAQFAVDFIDQNPLCVCAEEIVSIKRLLTGDSDVLKIRQKSRSVTMRMEKSSYFAEVRFTIPEDYPRSRTSVDLKACNFPRHFINFFKGQSEEIARQCVEPPLLRKSKTGGPVCPEPFVFKKSLQPVAKFLIENIRRYPTENCPICRTTAFPANPAEVTEVATDPRFIDRVYCSHIYHYGCLDKYMKTPPFKGGKKCLACELLIYHDKWRESDQMREDRWAHEQARIREIDEVIEFLK